MWVRVGDTSLRKVGDWTSLRHLYLLKYTPTSPSLGIHEFTFPSVFLFFLRDLIIWYPHIIFCIWKMHSCSCLHPVSYFTRKHNFIIRYFIISSTEAILSKTTLTYYYIFCLASLMHRPFFITLMHFIIRKSTHIGRVHAASVRPIPFFFIIHILKCISHDLLLWNLCCTHEQP
jgi:hypothetical protein